jgi:hypothetical protein
MTENSLRSGSGSGQKSSRSATVAGYSPYCAPCNGLFCVMVVNYSRVFAMEYEGEGGVSLDCYIGIMGTAKKKMRKLKKLKLQLEIFCTYCTVVFCSNRMYVPWSYIFKKKDFTLFWTK